MKQSQLDEVIACLPKEKTCFYYHRDRYVLYLLGRLQQHGGMRTIRDVKKSRYAHWLNKPLIKDWLARCGRDDIALAELLHYWPQQSIHNYVLNLAQWGNEQWNPWYQTSRAGLNAVLQLNLPLSHVKNFRDQGVGQVWRYGRWHHPMSEQRITLAWARLDWDWKTGQAMIEEIQSDWLRDYAELNAAAKHAKQEHEDRVWWRNGWLPVDVVLDYQTDIQQHQKTWSEAMLTAALWFLQEELGFKEVFYHAWQTGNALKRLDDEHIPPRSLYSDLPEKFAFERVNKGPLFLESDPKVKKVKKRQDIWQWYRWAA